MANLKYKIGVLTVTYGNRWIFLSEVIKRVLSFEQVTDLIIVNNAAPYDLNDGIQAFGDSRIQVINFARNTGSAEGYKAALQTAYEKTNADFYLLLDDDNLPDVDILERLIVAWTGLKERNPITALYCMRDDRTAHVRIAAGEDPYRYYLVPNNFLGFNIFRIAYNQFQKLKDKFRKQSNKLSYAAVPYVPYGGLFVPRHLIEQIGYPDERFFLYVDDSEFSYRITAAGGAIWLVPGAQVKDIDKSQGGIYVKRWFASALLDHWSFRTYYQVRNRLFFYGQVTIKNRFIFRLNKFLLLAWLKLISIIRGQQRQYKKLLVAIDDGLKCKLGEADAKKF